MPAPHKAPKKGTDAKAATKIAVGQACERWWSARGISATTIAMTGETTIADGAGAMVTGLASPVVQRDHPGPATELRGQARS